MQVREVTFELREGTSAEWTAINPVLRAGEPGYERDTNQLKIGNGQLAWVDLPYLTGGSGGSVSSVFGRIGVVIAQAGDYTKAQVGLGNVDNTADSAKPVSTATQTALNAKADLVGGTVPYSQLPASDDEGYYPSHAYGFFSMSGPPVAFENSSYTGDNFVQFTRLWVPPNKAINGVGLVIMTSGVADVAAGIANGLAVYSDSGSLLAVKSGGAAFWTSVPGWRTLTFDSPVAAQATGRFVYFALLVQGYPVTNPFLMYKDTPVEALNGGVGVTNRRHFFNSGVTSFPASVDTLTYGTTSSFMVLCGLF